MGHQIIQQPNRNEDGEALFAVFSTFSDTIVLFDGTRAEVIDWFAEAAAERARRDVAATLDKVAAGEPREAYHQFVMTWEQALDQDRTHGGEVWQEFQAEQQQEEEAGRG